MKSSSAWTVLLLAVTFSLPVHAQFPRKSIVEIPNGVSAPFVGKWSVGFPEAEGMINGDPKVSCDQPVQLEANGAHDLVYHSPNGDKIEFELRAFSDRTTWRPENGESLIAVWTDVDEFFSYSVDFENGRARWNDPNVYRRCK